MGDILNYWLLALGSVGIYVLSVICVYAMRGGTSDLSRREVWSRMLWVAGYLALLEGVTVLTALLY